MRDQEIIELFNQRNEDAITQTDRKYRTQSMGVSINILGNESDAKECVNDSYLVLWNKIPPEVPKSLCAYLLKIVRNISLKLYEKNTAKKRNSYFDAALDELSECIGDKNSPDEYILAKELGEYINKFLASLPKKHRIVFVQRYWYAYPVSDVAEKNGMTVHNTTVLLGRIRNKLKDYLAKEGYVL